MMNSGFLLPGFPCLGAWTSYALGNLTDNLPTFVVLPDGRGLPYNERGTFSSGFLPPIHQGTVIKANSKSPVPHLFANEQFSFATSESEREGLSLLKKSTSPTLPNTLKIRALSPASALTNSPPKCNSQHPKPSISRANQNTSIKPTGPTTQSQKTSADAASSPDASANAAPDSCKFGAVPKETKTTGTTTAAFPRNLLRSPLLSTNPSQPSFEDLKQRGLLEDTLLVWTTEFGRTPFAQGADGRDHNGGTFVTWMAGAGIKAGTSYGQSDDLAFQTAEGTTYCYDLHATIYTSWASITNAHRPSERHRPPPH
jgi:hypothetical protein